MLKLVTETQLLERDRLTRVETMLNAFDGRMTIHEEDCLKDREATRGQINQINDKIDKNHNEWRMTDDTRHRDNVRLLVMILLAILGYIAAQVLEHINWSKVQREKIDSQITYEEGR